jgi:WW domain
MSEYEMNTREYHGGAFIINEEEINMFRQKPDQPLYVAGQVRGVFLEGQLNNAYGTPLNKTTKISMFGDIHFHTKRGFNCGPDDDTKTIYLPDLLIKKIKNQPNDVIDIFIELPYTKTGHGAITTFDAIESINRIFHDCTDQRFRKAGCPPNVRLHSIDIRHYFWQFYAGNNDDLSEFFNVKARVMNIITYEDEYDIRYSLSKILNIDAYGNAYPDDNLIMNMILNNKKIQSNYLAIEDKQLRTFLRDSIHAQIKLIIANHPTNWNNIINLRRQEDIIRARTHNQYMFLLYTGSAIFDFYTLSRMLKKFTRRNRLYEVHQDYASDIFYVAGDNHIRRARAILLGTGKFKRVAPELIKDFTSTEPDEFSDKCLTFPPEFDILSKMFGYKQISDSTLPQDWVKIYDDTHIKNYYYNTVTKESIWTKPEQMTVDQLPADWVEIYDNTYKKNYYYNRVTKKSIWTKPEQMTVDQLPADWVEIYDNNHKKNYYYNRVTKKSVWTKPEQMAVDQLPADWVEIYDNTYKKNYYYNRVTKKSVWTKPT